MPEKTWDEKVQETVNKCRQCEAAEEIENLKQTIESLKEEVHQIHFGRSEH